MFNKKQQDYSRVTSFDVIKQSTDIFAHQITFSSRKFIFIHCLVFNQSILFVRSENIFFCLKYRCQRVYVCHHHYFDRQQFRRLSLAHSSQGVLCIVQERPKIISSS